MKLFSSDGEFAFFSVGQQPVGIIAIGQAPLGVVAIGQLSRGIFVVGQLAIGVVVLGQAAFGLVCVGQLVIAPAWGTGMLGIVGRGRGWVLRLLPRWQPARVPSAVTLTPESALLDGTATRGWLEVRRDERGTLVTNGGHPILGDVVARVPAGAVADVVAEIVATEPTDFRAPARAIQLRCMDIQATLPGHFVTRGWVGKIDLAADTPASTAEVIARVGVALALAAVVLLGLAVALLAD